MTMPYSPSRVVYEGNDAATRFPFSFKVWDASQLVVTLTSPGGVTTEASGWTADLGASGGEIVYLHGNAALPAGWKLAVTRDMPFTQEVNLVSASRFDPQVIEDALDQATAERQQVKEMLGRAVILPATSSETPQDVVQAVYAARDDATAAASSAAGSQFAAAASAGAAADSAATAAQTVEAAAATAVTAATAQANRAESEANAAAQSAMDAAAAVPENLVQRVANAESKSIEQDVHLEAHDGRIASAESEITALNTILIGSVFAHTATDSYVPNGCVPANGGEYTRAQFPAFYDAYLAGGKLLTCTYSAFATQVAITGNCAKFALDADNQTFKVPLYKDGDSITQAASSAEIGKSYNAALPNATGSTSSGNGAMGVVVQTGFSGSGVFAGNTMQLAAWSLYGGTLQGMSALNFDLSKSNPIYRNDVDTVLDEQIRLRHFVVLASAQNNASIFDWSNYMAALAGKVNTDLRNATSNAIGFYFYARDEKPSGTIGGSNTANAWMTRDVNTVVHNSIAGAYLSANGVTLPAGRYYIEARMPVALTEKTRGALYNVTSSSYMIYSPSVWAQYDHYEQTPLTLNEEITLTEQSTLELRMWASRSYTNGCGFPSGVSGVPEIYSELRIWKM